MFHRGTLTSFATPNDALAAGIAMVFQETSLVPSMTVAQNLYLGSEKFLNRLRGIYISAQQFLQSLNFAVDPTAMVETLGAAKRQMVEIARAVHHNAEVIIFDEPTATLTPEEKRHFFALLRRLKARGVSIVFISHALEEALAISDRITILRDGELVAHRRDRRLRPRQASSRPWSGAAFRPRSTRQREMPRLRKPGRKVLSVQDISHGRHGAQHSLFGLRGPDHRRLRPDRLGPHRNLQDRRRHRQARLPARRHHQLDDRPVRYVTPFEAVHDGIIYVTEDRKTEGIFETMRWPRTCSAACWLRVTSQTRVVRLARDARRWPPTGPRRLNIRVLNDNARVVELSGGNQQKVVIGKGLVQNPRVVIFDEPTRGVDVAAIAEIHQIINGLADAGPGGGGDLVSYLPEVLNLSDRILVCRQGRIVEELSPLEATEEKIMYAAVH